jgi:hypothetical protein
VLRWRWSPNQFVLFDNRTTQHYAIDNDDGPPRGLHPITVAGEIRVGVDGTELLDQGRWVDYSPVVDVRRAA